MAGWLVSLLVLGENTQAATYLGSESAKSRADPLNPIYAEAYPYRASPRNIKLPCIRSILNSDCRLAAPPIKLIYIATLQQLEPRIFRDFYEYIVKNMRDSSWTITSTRRIHRERIPKSDSLGATRPSNYIILKGDLRGGLELRGACALKRVGLPLTPLHSKRGCHKS